MIDAEKFNKILKDPDIFDLMALKRKWGELEFNDFLGQYRSYRLKPIALPDYTGRDIYVDMHRVAIDRLLGSNIFDKNVDIEQSALKDEAKSTMALDKGVTEHEDEGKPGDIVKGLKFIANPKHKISEENIFKLYSMTTDVSIRRKDALRIGDYYRIKKTSHRGLDGKKYSSLANVKIPVNMAKLVEFINEDKIDLLTKAAIAHFYFLYISPYTDGNGRMGRLMHLWVIANAGYPNILNASISELMLASAEKYEMAFKSVMDNKRASSFIDVTPFISYCYEEIYEKVDLDTKPVAKPVAKKRDKYEAMLDKGLVTEKESDLWRYVNEVYGDEDFSTKRLEKDYGKAAYATIRSFVLKFNKHGLLDVKKYSNRNKYSIRG